MAGRRTRRAAVAMDGAALYALGWAIHTADHLRLGTSVTTTEVLMLGAVSGVLQVLAITAVFLKHRWAPLLAVGVGLPGGIGIIAVHLLPRWSSSFSDALPGAHGRARPPAAPVGSGPQQRTQEVHG